MAQIRTKEQKQQAQQHRMSGAGTAPTPTFSYSATQSKVEKSRSPKQELADITLLPYARKDLRKTTVVSLLLFGVLVGFSFYLRYN